MSEGAFMLFAALSLFSATGVVLLKNPVHSALSLVATMFLIAISYAVMGAHLVAALQIIVYAGAVMVLFLFVIMLLNVQADPQEPRAFFPTVIGFAVAGLMAAPIAYVLWAWSTGDTSVAAVAEDFGTTKTVARHLFNNRLVSFELTSVLLLVAVVGAVVVARREDS